MLFFPCRRSDRHKPDQAPHVQADHSAESNGESSNLKISLTIHHCNRFLGVFL